MSKTEIKEGEFIFYAGAFYEVAKVFNELPLKNFIGIYDEPPTKHIDLLNINNIKRAVHCNNCQGGGCPTCSGFGMMVN
jgi:hypothetical protein